MKDFYTVSEAAKELSCHNRTVFNWIHAGKIKAYRVLPKSPWRIPAAEMERLKYSQPEKVSGD